MHIKYFLLGCILMTVFTACKKEVKGYQKDDKDALIVSCFLAPQQQQITVELGVALSTFEGAKEIKEEELKDAYVEIRSDSVTKKVLWSGSGNVFVLPTAQMPIIAGKTYFLKVELPSGLTATASTTVPSAPLETTYTHQKIRDSSSQHGMFVAERYLITGNLPDNDKNALYRVSIYAEDTISGGERVIAKDLYTSANNTYFLFDFQHFGKLFSEGYGLQVSNLSKEYYLYAVSLENSVKSEDNPFTEQATLYTNIKGGIGIFASFNYKRYKFDFLN